MKIRNLIYPLLFLICLFFNFAAAKIIETPNLIPFEKAINKLDKNALVIFDVDQTLIVFQDAILRHSAGRLIQKIIHSQMNNLSKEQAEYLASKVLLNGKVMLVDPSVKNLLAKLKQSQIHTIALTAVQPGSFGAIPSLVDWRINQLNELGIHFSDPNDNFREYSQFKHQGNSPILKKGILFSGKYPKGRVLKAYLDNLDWKPSKILFIDDQKDYIISVETSLDGLGIPHVSFHYTGADLLPFQYDEEVANFQLHYLFTYGEWIGEEEAKDLCSVKN